MIFNPDTHLYDLRGRYHWTPQRAKAAWDRTWDALEDYLQWNAKPEKAVILMGAPGSGKSTWLRKNRVIEAIYFDACFDLDWKRAKFTKRVWARYPGLPIECVWLDTPAHLCKERNAARPSDRQVPEAAIDKMTRYISECPPDAEKEGFARVIRVKESSGPSGDRLVKLHLGDIPEDYRTPSDEQLWEVYDQILYVKWGFDRWEHYLRTIGMTRSKANRVVNRQYTSRAVEKVIAR